MATIAETWQPALPLGSRIVAGEAGLWHEVTSTTRLRPRPPGFAELAGGELAFVSLQSLYSLDENLTLALALSRLAEMRVAAVAVLGDVDETARAAADRLSLPLIVLPPETNLAAAEQAAMRAILERQADIYRRAQDAYRQLTQLAIEGRGLPVIVEKLAHIAGKPAAMQDAAGHLRLYSSPREGWLSRLEASTLLRENDAALGSWLRGVALSASDPPVSRFDLPGRNLARLVAPIVSRDGVAGFLSLLGEPGHFGEVDRLAVAHGAAACAIEMARQQAAVDAQDQMQIGVVDELLAGGSAVLESVRERALRLGYDLAAPHAVLVFQLPESAAGASPMALPRAIEREIARRRVRAALRPRGLSVSVLYPLDEALPDVALKRLAEDLRAAVAGRLEQPALCVGLGRLHQGMAGLRSAHQEAEQALSLGLSVLGSGRVVYFGDLGLYRMLFNIREKDGLRAFHAEMLGKIIDYDRRTGAELVSTLAAYFAARNSPTEAAERMHLHRNTFLYRLQRIREITGLDLDDPETRLALHLALRIGDTLRAIEGRSHDAPATPAKTPTTRRPRQQGKVPLSRQPGLA